MARRPFGGDLAAWAMDAAGNPVAGSDAQGNPVYTGTAWTGETGGTQVTDLQYTNGAAIPNGVLIPKQDGRLPLFLGPNSGLGKLWLDFGAGRQSILATDDTTRLDSLESGGVQPVGAQYPATAVVYSSQYRNGAPATDTAQFTYTCSGTADQTVINQAITAVNAKGGGRVLLLGPLFNLTGSIQLRTAVHLCGEGFGTQIKAVSDFTAGMVTLFDNGTHLTKFTDATLDGQGRNVSGVHYTANGGQIFTSSPSSNPDPSHVLRDLFIKSVGSSTYAGYGIRLTGGNLRAGKYSDIRIQAASGCGVWADGAVDSHFTNIEIGSSGSGGPTPSHSSTAPVGVGFYFSQGDNCMITACKAWYSRAAGFYNRATRNGYTNCQGQDNYGPGFESAFGKTSFVNCHADSNGQGEGANSFSRAGFRITADLITVQGCMSYDRGGQAWAQQYGFEFTSGFANGRVGGCVTFGNALSSINGSPAASTTVDVRADGNGK